MAQCPDRPMRTKVEVVFIYLHTLTLARCGDRGWSGGSLKEKQPTARAVIQAEASPKYNQPLRWVVLLSYTNTLM